MTIDEIIKYLPAPICGDAVIGKEKQKEYDAHDSAIIILHKYQKIAEIVTNNGLEWGNTSVRANALLEVKKVVEDGNE